MGRTNTDLSLPWIDPSLPWIKSNSVVALTHKYTNETEALQGIATLLAERYPNEPRIRPAIAAVQEIYKDNFFPEMNASRKNYPDNIGHKNWAGCFRCHDGSMSARTASGRSPRTTAIRATSSSRRAVAGICSR